MKEMDFDIIGKRLYDLEADPPEGEWNRIAPAISAPHPMSSLVWLRRHWWKSLILLLTVSFYLLSTLADMNGVKLTSGNSRITMAAESATTPTVTSETESSKNVSDGSPSIANKDANQPKKTSRLQLAEKPEVITDMLHTVKPKRNGSLKDVSSRPLKHLVASIESASKNLISEDARITDKASVVTHRVSADSNSTSINSNGAELFGVRTNVVTFVMQDSLVAEVAKLVVADSILYENVLQKAKEEKAKNGWRINAMITPQVVKRSVRPIINDEVLVTSIVDKRKSLTEKLGFGFAVGAGRSLTRNIYIDAQLAYVRTGQDLFYSYSTGEVDTMLAIAQTHETVRLTPVYRTMTKETSTRFSHGAIRLAGTYYFWTKGRRRFNVTASLSANYLLSSEVRDRTRLEWTRYENATLNKLNYTFSVGGGYNIFLGKDWEIMISPVLLYNIRQIRSKALPYHLRQQSAGVNIMLSKYLGVKD